MTPTHDEEMALLVQADLDGELDAARRAELVAHIAGCAECRALHAGLAALSTRLRTSLPYHAATPALRAAVARRLAEASAASLPAPTPSAPGRPSLHAWRGGWWAAGLGLLAGAALAGLLMAVLPPGEHIAREIVAAEARAALPGHRLDAPTPDPAALAQWFASRLPYRLAPARAEAAGFTLIGGRLDAVHGRVVPVLVYRRGDGVAELYIWPEPGHAPQPPKALRRGRNALLYWRDKGMEYWAAGTLAPGELAAFVAQWRA